MDDKTKDIMKILMIILIVAAIGIGGYLLYKNMNKPVPNADSSIQNDIENGMNNIENAGENIMENVENTAKYTMDSIEEMFKDEKDMVKEEVNKMENDKYKRAQKYKIGEDEFTVYEFDNEAIMDEVSMEDKFKNMIRKGNLFIETTSEKIKNKINELT